MAKHLNKKQKKIWSTISKRFDLVSVSSRIEKYWVSSSLNLDPNKVKIIGIQRREFYQNNLQINNNTVSQLEKIFSRLKIKKRNLDLKNLTLILYAPTHRDHSQNFSKTMLENIDGYNLKQLNLFLKENNMFLFLREHAISKLDANYENDTDTMLLIFRMKNFQI